jgi:hypothetical protein
MSTKFCYYREKSAEGYGKRIKRMGKKVKSFNDSTESLCDLTESLCDLTESLCDLSFIRIETSVFPYPFFYLYPT